MQKNVLLPYQVAAAQSLASAFTTPATVIKYLDNIEYQINVVTSNSTGSFIVQTSLDYIPTNDPGGPAVAGNWTDLTLSGTPSVAAANDTISIALNQISAVAVRLKYVPVIAGTGTCAIYIAGKSI